MPTPRAEGRKSVCGDGGPGHARRSSHAPATPPAMLRPRPWPRAGSGHAPGHAPATLLPACGSTLSQGADAAQAVSSPRLSE